MQVEVGFEFCMICSGCNFGPFKPMGDELSISLSLSLYMYIYTYISKYTYICMCVCIYIYIYTHMCIYTYVGMVVSFRGKHLSNATCQHTSFKLGENCSKSR